MKPANSEKVRSQFSSWESVAPNFSKWGSGPMFSLDYHFCRGVVLQGEGKGALMHLYPKGNPATEIAKMVESLRTKPGRLKAAVIEAAIDYYPTDLSKELAHLTIPLVYHYRGEIYFD